MEDNLIIKLLDKKTLKQQTEVYMCSFDVNMSVEKVIDKWEKEHYQNPVHEAYIFGVFDNKRLVSINAYMPMKYIFNGTECNVIQSCMSGTIPEYRGKGIWGRLVKYAVEYFKSEGKYDFLIGFPNYRNSYNGFLKMGWSHDSDAINYLMIVNGKKFVKAALGKNILLTEALGIQRLRVNLINTMNFQIGDPFVTDDINKEGFLIAADEGFIKWKELYKGLESFGVYSSDGIPVASCRYFISDYKGVKIIILCRVVIVDRMRKETAVYSFCLKEIAKKHKDAAYIRVWAMDGSRYEKIYRFLMFAKAKNHSNPFITYGLKENVIPFDELHRKENWENASFLDLD